MGWEPKRPHRISEHETNHGRGPIEECFEPSDKMIAVWPREHLTISETSVINCRQEAMDLIKWMLKILEKEAKK